MRPEPDQFASVPLFASLTPDQRDSMASLTELRTESTGTQLIGEGAPGYALFILLEGTAKVTSGGAEPGMLGPGDFFGEIALLGSEGRRSATVTATSDVTLAVMFGSDFRVFERDFPEAVNLMMQAMVDRLSAS